MPKINKFLKMAISECENVFFDLDFGFWKLQFADDKILLSLQKIFL